MSKKKNSGGIVYSTDPGFNSDTYNKEEEGSLALAASQQKLKVRLDKKHRAGKVVTLIENFIGPEDDMNDLAKKLKSFCGTGGSVKDGEIIIQGDHTDKIMQWLQKNGYTSSKKY